MLSGRGLYDELITCPEESYRVLYCLNVFVKEAVVHCGGLLRPGVWGRGMLHVRQ